MTTHPGRLDHARYCDEILHQTRQSRQVLTGADLTARVPTCPDWNLRKLAVHMGAAHRWADAIVRSRATEFVPFESVPGVGGPTTDDAEALDDWLAQGAEQLADTLREAGPRAPVWTWSAHGEAGFWARRMTHETAIHRADACAAVAANYEITPEVATDCLDEWLEILSSPEARAFDEGLRSLSERAGKSLHLHATDTEENLAGADAEWLIELDADGAVTWQRTHGKATVALRGPLTDVLRAFYRRLPLDSDRLEVVGDAEFLYFLLERTRFGG